MEVVMTTVAIRRAKLQPICHRQQTNIQLFIGQMLFLSPNRHCRSMLKHHISRTCSPQADLGLLTLSLYRNKAPHYLAGCQGLRVANPLASPLTSLPRLRRKST